MVFAKRLSGTITPTYRFQTGKYRAVFDWEGKKETL